MKDLGLLVDCKLNMSQWCDAVAKNAHVLVGRLTRNVTKASLEPHQPQ